MNFTFFSQDADYLPYKNYLTSEKDLGFYVYLNLLTLFIFVCRPKVFKMQNVTITPSSGGNEALQFTLQPGNNYGPYFGIYISQGYREKAKYIAKRSCFCGRDYMVDGINPLKNTFTNYVCN